MWEPMWNLATARHQQIVDSFSAEMEASQKTVLDSTFLDSNAAHVGLMSGLSRLQAAVTEEAVAAFFSLQSPQGAVIHILHGLRGRDLVQNGSAFR